MLMCLKRNDLNRVIRLSKGWVASVQLFSLLSPHHDYAYIDPGSVANAELYPCRSGGPGYGEGFSAIFDNVLYGHGYSTGYR